MQVYSNPARESDAYALPDVEVFYVDATEAAANAASDDDYGPDGVSISEPGYYYWYCFPGCMPDSDPIGPFQSAAEAKQAAIDNASE